MVSVAATEVRVAYWTGVTVMIEDDDRLWDDKQQCTIKLEKAAAD